MCLTSRFIQDLLETPKKKKKINEKDGLRKRESQEYTYVVQFRNKRPRKATTVNQRPLELVKSFGQPAIPSESLRDPFRDFILSLLSSRIFSPSAIISRKTKRDLRKNFQTYVRYSTYGTKKKETYKKFIVQF